MHMDVILQGEHLHLNVHLNAAVTSAGPLTAGN